MNAAGKLLYPEASVSVNRTVLQATLLVAMTVTAYLPTLQAGFIWDDDDYVTENELLRAPDGLRRIWLSMDSPSQYFPAVYTSFRIEYSLWGLDASGYHLTNLVLHILNILLVYGIFKRLLGDPFLAFGAALLFGIHPVQVEAVSWVSERKNLLFSLFFLAGFNLVVLKQSRDDSKIIYGAVFLFALSLLSKVTAFMIPFVCFAFYYFHGEKKTKWNLNLKNGL